MHEQFDTNNHIAVLYDSMRAENAAFAQGVCIEAVKLFGKNDLKDWKDAAKYIKQEHEKKIGGSWHVIVGKSYGAFFTYEVECLMHLSIGNLKFVIYKHG